nr:hypothetical protein BaRGS_023089 [Batillaria attramentaria]
MDSFAPRNGKLSQSSELFIPENLLMDEPAKLAAPREHLATRSRKLSWADTWPSAARVLYFRIASADGDGRFTSFPADFVPGVYFRPKAGWVRRGYEVTADAEDTVDTPDTGSYPAEGTFARGSSATAKSQFVRVVDVCLCRDTSF